MIKAENLRKMKKMRVNKRILQQAGIKNPVFFFDKLNKTEWITVVKCSKESSNEQII